MAEKVTRLRDRQVNEAFRAKAEALAANANIAVTAANYAAKQPAFLKAATEMFDTQAVRADETGYSMDRVCVVSPFMFRALAAYQLDQNHRVVSPINDRALTEGSVERIKGWALAVDPTIDADKTAGGLNGTMFFIDASGDSWSYVYDQIEANIFPPDKIDLRLLDGGHPGLRRGRSPGQRRSAESQSRSRRKEGHMADQPTFTLSDGELTLELRDLSLAEGLELQASKLTMQDFLEQVLVRYTADGVEYTEPRSRHSLRLFQMATEGLSGKALTPAGAPSLSPGTCLPGVTECCLQTSTPDSPTVTC